MTDATDRAQAREEFLCYSFRTLKIAPLDEGGWMIWLWSSYRAVHREVLDPEELRRLGLEEERIWLEARARKNQGQAEPSGRGTRRADVTMEELGL